MSALHMDSLSPANRFFDQLKDAFVYAAFSWRRYLLAQYDCALRLLNGSEICRSSDFAQRLKRVNTSRPYQFLAIGWSRPLVTIEKTPPRRVHYLILISSMKTQSYINPRQPTRYWCLCHWLSATNEQL